MNIATGACNFDNFILVFDPRPCVICTKPTWWVEVNFEAPLCPGVCDETLWQDYFRACREPPANPDDVVINL